MSMKPGKKGDENKAWRKRGRRSAPKTMAPERHLIVCEGTRTEPLYFESMRESLAPGFRDRIHIVVKGTGLHTTDLFEYAVAECSRSKNGYDHVWIAYDKDDFLVAKFDEVARRCRGTRVGDARFHAMWSNPCFEVWLLLHFGYSTSEIVVKQCIDRVDSECARRFGCGYAKNFSVYGQLASMRGAACDNSKRLIAWHEGQGKDRPSAMNPGTAVHEMVDSLGQYLGMENGVAD